MIAGVGGASIAGPFTITDYTSFDGTATYVDTTGRTLNNTPISAGERALVGLNVSQSNYGNWMATNYTVTNTGNIFSVLPGVGDCYRYADPVLGSTGSGGCIDGNILDGCIGAAPKWDKAIMINVSVASTGVNDWRSTRTAANKAMLYHRLQVGLRHLRAFLQAQPSSATINAFIMSGIAELDAFANLDSAIFTAAYREIIAARDGLQLSHIPWFIHTCTWNAGNTNATIQAAIASLVDNVSIFAGVNSDDLSGRQDGNTHFNDTTRATVASRMVNILTAHSW